MTVASSTITRNVAAGSGAKGGGIFSQAPTATLAVIDSEISHNSGRSMAVECLHGSAGLVSRKRQRNRGQFGGRRWRRHKQHQCDGYRQRLPRKQGRERRRNSQHRRLTVNESTISGNVAGVGGGILSRLSSADQFMVKNSTMSGNTVSGNGGGMYLFAVDPGAIFSVRQTTVAGNVASGFGGGIEVVGGTLMLANSIVAGGTQSRRWRPIWRLFSAP